MSDELDDPIALFEAVKATTAKEAAQFNRLTREVFTSQKGRKWLRVAMAKHNFMGSVFSADDEMNPGTAAFRDGVRSFFSEILNSAAAGKSKPTEPYDDEN